MNSPPGLGDDDDDSIGPPPGIEIPKKKKFLINKKQSQQQTSLESLNLELKLTVQDQHFDQIPTTDEYLEPSMNNLISFNDSDTLALWDKEMKLKREFKGLIQNIPYSLVAVHDKIYFIFGDTLLLIQPEINKNTILLTTFCVSGHTNPRIIRNHLVENLQFSQTQSQGTHLQQFCIQIPTID